MRFWIDQVASTMGAAGRNPDAPPPEGSVEHQLYDALMKEVVYGVPYNPNFSVEPGGRTRFTDPATGNPLGPGEVPPSIAEDRMLREGINHLGMEGRRLRVSHLTYNFSPRAGQAPEHAGTNFTRIAGTLARKGGVLYISPPLAGLAGEAKIAGLPVDVNDAMQQALNTVATRVHYGFLTDPNMVVRFDEEIDEIMPKIGEQMGPSMQYLAAQIRGTGVQVQLLGMDRRPKVPSQLMAGIRAEMRELLESKGKDNVEARVERIRSALTLVNYTEWHLLGEVGADLATRSPQGRRIRDAAILTTHHYAGLVGKLEGCSIRVDAANSPALTRLQTCGQRGYVDPVDFPMIFRQE